VVLIPRIQAKETDREPDTSCLGKNLKNKWFLDTMRVLLLMIFSMGVFCEVDRHQTPWRRFRVFQRGASASREDRHYRKNESPPCSHQSKDVMNWKNSTARAVVLVFLVPRDSQEESVCGNDKSTTPSSQRVQSKVAALTVMAISSLLLFPLVNWIDCASLKRYVLAVLLYIFWRKMSRVV
jgi:hypothetical protein